MIFAIKLLIQTNDITKRNREEDDEIRKNRIWWREITDVMLCIISFINFYRSG